MNKTKFFLTTGSLVLACSAVLMAKPAKKFTTLSAELKGIGSGAGTVAVVVTASLFTTVQGSHHTAVLATSAGTKIATLLTGTSGAAKVYFK